MATEPSDALKLFATDSYFRAVVGCLRQVLRVGISSGLLHDAVQIATQHLAQKKLALEVPKLFESYARLEPSFRWSCAPEPAESYEDFRLGLLYEPELRRRRQTS